MDSAKDKCSSGTGPGFEDHVWIKWYGWSHYAFYALLAGCSLLAAVDPAMSWERLGLALGLAIMLGGWYALTILTHPQWIEVHHAKIVVYFVVALTLLAGLAHLHPAYYLMIFIFYWHNFSLWGTRWAIPGAATLTLFMIWSSSGYENPLALILEGPLPIGFFVISLIVSTVLAIFIDAVIRQSRERRRLIGELEATREELARGERRAGILEERGRLAREIHDTLAQGFISIVTHLEAAGEEDASDDALRHLEQAKRTARENLVEARRLVAALRPEILESSSLPEALERLAKRLSETSDVSIELNVTGDGARLSQELQVTLLRAAQEALSNARRHARANNVSMTLSYAGDFVLLDIQDDGVGFDPEATPIDADGGFGLCAMRERVERLGGQLLVESEQGEGTTLAVQLPVGAEQTVERR